MERESEAYAGVGASGVRYEVERGAVVRWNERIEWRRTVKASVACFVVGSASASLDTELLARRNSPREAHLGVCTAAQRRVLRRGRETVRCCHCNEQRVNSHAVSNSDGADENRSCLLGKEERVVSAEDCEQGAEKEQEDTVPGGAGGAMMSRRNMLQRTGIAACGLAAAAVGSRALFAKIEPAEAVSIAQTPINPYAKRNRRRALKRYMEEHPPIAPTVKTVVAREEDAVPYTISAVVAFVASAVSTLVSHPVDTIKTRLQVQASVRPVQTVMHVEDSSGASATALHASSAHTVHEERLVSEKSSAAVAQPFDVVCMQSTTRCEELEARGALFTDLYRGVWSNVLKEAPNCAIYIGMYELIKTALLQFSVFKAFPIFAFLIAGGLGDAVGSVVRVPAELVNKRLQLGLSSSFGSALLDIRSQPFSSIRSSWLAVLFRDVPFGALQIAFYEQFKLLALAPETKVLGTTVISAVTGGDASELTNAMLSASGGLWQDCLLGATAGMLAAVITTPPDVVVTRLSSEQTSASSSRARNSGGEARRASLLSTTARIYEEEGFFGFFRGSVQRGVYYAPLIGIFFALYEAGRHLALHPDTILAWLDALHVTSSAAFDHAASTLLSYVDPGYSS